jgi:hypothetical protein
MIPRVVSAVILTVIIMVAVIEVSTWLLGRAVSAVVPAASVSEVEAEVPQASEVDAPKPVAVPALTW